MKTAQQWFAEYGDSHRNPINKLIHWICVPAIYWTVAALLYALPMPFADKSWLLNWATVVMLVVFVFYFRLGVAFGLGMAVFSVACLLVSDALSSAPWPLWQIAVAVFVVAWIFQFIGHAIEGKRPSFFQDLQFLLVGPAWLLGFVYRKVGIGY
jgi:uncharacterized membrane protein YGL010W